MSSVITPVHRTKVALAYEFLRERILSGELAPGQKLTLSSLAQLLGTSHMPVREAVLKLEQEDLVELTPHTGMRVTPLRPMDVRELFQVRAALEGLAARLACQNITNKVIAELQDKHNRFELCFRAEDFPGMADANWGFHQIILEAAGNSQLVRGLDDIWAKCFRFRAGYRLIPGRSESTVREHNAILECLRRRDEEGAARAAFQHSDQAGSDLFRTLSAAAEAEQDSAQPALRRKRRK